MVLAQYIETVQVKQHPMLPGPPTRTVNRFRLTCGACGRDYVLDLDADYTPMRRSVSHPECRSLIALTERISVIAWHTPQSNTLDLSNTSAVPSSSGGSL